MLLKAPYQLYNVDDLMFTFPANTLSGCDSQQTDSGGHHSNSPGSSSNRGTVMIDNI